MFDMHLYKTLLYCLTLSLCSFFNVKKYLFLLIMHLNMLKNIFNKCSFVCWMKNVSSLQCSCHLQFHPFSNMLVNFKPGRMAFIVEGVGAVYGLACSVSIWVARCCRRISKALGLSYIMIQLQV